MPTINRFADFHDQITEWRQEIHANPGLLYEVEETAALVSEKLEEFGVDEIIGEIGKTGVVGIIKGKTNNSGKVIGLRADMDALPIPGEYRTPLYVKKQRAHACLWSRRAYGNAVGCC